MAWQRTGSLRFGLAAQVATAADGTFSLAFPTGLFTAPPAVTHGVLNASGDGRDYVVTLTAVSAASLAGQVRKSRMLPALVGALAVLVNYDTFVPAAGCTVYLMAERVT